MKKEITTPVPRYKVRFCSEEFICLYLPGETWKKTDSLQSVSHELLSQKSMEGKSVPVSL